MNQSIFTMKYKFTGQVVTSWRNFLEEEKSCADKEGLVLIQELIDYVDPISEALHLNDHKRVVPLFEKCISTSKRLLPHITCNDLRQIHSSQIDTCQKVINTIQTANSPNADGLNLFLRGTYTNLFSKSKSLLSALGKYKPGIHSFLSEEYTDFLTHSFIYNQISKDLFSRGDSI